MDENHFFQIRDQLEYIVLKSSEHENLAFSERFGSYYMDYAIVQFELAAINALLGEPTDKIKNFLECSLNNYTRAIEFGYIPIQHQAIIALSSAIIVGNFNLSNYFASVFYDLNSFKDSMTLVQDLLCCMIRRDYRNINFIFEHANEIFETKALNSSDLLFIRTKNSYDLLKSAFIKDHRLFDVLLFKRFQILKDIQQLYPYKVDIYWDLLSVAIIALDLGIKNIEIKDSCFPIFLIDKLVL